MAWVDKTKKYFDSNDNECSINQMVEREPHWAANRIQAGESAIEELTRLRAELAAVSRAIGSPRYMDPPDGGDVALSEQVLRMKAELAAERKKVKDLEFRLQDWHDAVEKAWKSPCDDEQHCSCVPLLRKQCDNFESQVEVLREALCKIAEWPVGAQQHIAKKALAKLPTHAEKVKAVLEAAGTWVDGETGSAELSEAVLKWRKSCSHNQKENP